MYGYFCIGFIDFRLKDKSLTDFTNLFSPNNFKDNDKKILGYITNGEVHSMYQNLNDQTFRFKKINEIKDYFIC